MVIGMALSISFSRYEELGVQWLEKDLESPFGPEYLARAARHFERAEDIANRIDAIFFLQDEFDKPIFEPNSANDEKTNINEESESAICTEIGEYTERLRNVDVSKDDVFGFHDTSSQEWPIWDDDTGVEYLKKARGFHVQRGLE